VVLIPEGGRERPFLVETQVSRPGLLPIQWSSTAASDFNTAFKPLPDRLEPWLTLAKRYFASMPVLRALDVGGDLTLSPWEIANAPTALHSLDTSHAGKLTAEECGLRIDPVSGASAALSQLRRRFMNYHPALAALDADHDGEISAWEIDHAAAALKRLDRNQDGYLTAEELIPFEMALHTGLR
jgi:hypothetical protein